MKCFFWYIEDKPVVAESTEVVSALVEVVDSDADPVVAATVVVSPAVEEVPAVEVDVWSDVDAVEAQPVVEPVVLAAAEVVVEAATAFESVVVWPGVESDVEATVVESIDTKCNCYLQMDIY